MRLIDADATIEFIDIGHLRNPIEICFSERDVVDMLESRPTVDAVPVVRCCECRMRCPESISVVKHCTLTGIQTDDEDFCSYGEREEGDIK